MQRPELLVESVRLEVEPAAEQVAREPQPPDREDDEPSARCNETPQSFYGGLERQVLEHAADDHEVERLLGGEGEQVGLDDSDALPSLGRPGGSFRAEDVEHSRVDVEGRDAGGRVAFADEFGHRPGAAADVEHSRIGW